MRKGVPVCVGAAPLGLALTAANAVFKDRADISFYLRSLISSHHDSLGIKVQ